MKPRLLSAVTFIGDNQRRGEKDQFRFAIGDAVFLLVLARVSSVPLEALDAIKINHLRI